ncbi:MAG TPA: DUF4416 family protein [Dissulfurispiraceae bacterium]
MGSPRKPGRALLLVGLLFSDDNYRIKAMELLEEKFGEAVMESPPIPWDFSEYYREELGEPITRRFVFFKNLIEKDTLSSIKLITNEIESALSSGGKRTVNIDPGYLTLAKVVLASTKNYSHRLYLRDGIYAEVTMMYQKQKGRFVPHVNAYRDYTDERYQRFFLTARILLHFLTTANPK